jgi:ClpP class serine protease
MTGWLLAEQEALVLRDAMRSTSLLSRAAVEDRVKPNASPVSVGTDGVAVIRVEGILTKKPNVFARFFGGGNTTYRDIEASIAAAKNDPRIRSAVLLVDSPGGAVDGLFECLDAIAAFRAVKELRARASNAQSAAYAIAAAAGPIEAVGPASTFGSVGVAIDTWLDKDRLSLTNTDSPNKRPDLSTEKGRDIVVRHLDALHDLFVQAIAKGRKTTADAVRKGYGQGATLLAGEAKKLGMIDSIGTSAAASAGAMPSMRDIGDEIADAMGLPLAPDRHNLATTPAVPAAFDLGDQVAEVMAAEREHRVPAPWALGPLPAPFEPSDVAAELDADELAAAKLMAALERIDVAQAMRRR